MQAAWTAAACGRTKKLPKLSDLLSDKPRPKKAATSWQAMLANASAWVASVG
ncbi:MULTISPECIES: hypothetical protein [unclassified Sphingomonas]|uniref:hypothetical protein n=1 Tax=unclassified Sphingomonas TaxID=196159 RepID=UPI0012E18034|nr:MULTISPECIES: hypothetical protein [unclassified Sphingomonas]